MAGTFEQRRRERESDILDNLTRTQPIERCTSCGDPMTELDESHVSGLCIACALIEQIEEAMQ